MMVFERRKYGRILGSVNYNKKENQTILTNKEIKAIIKNPTKTETIMLHVLRWFGDLKCMEQNRISKRVLYEYGNKLDYEVDHEIDGNIKCGMLEK
jgi:hypothetical protein